MPPRRPWIATEPVVARRQSRPASSARRRSARARPEPSASRCVARPRADPEPLRRTRHRGAGRAAVTPAGGRAARAADPARRRGADPAGDAHRAGARCAGDARGPANSRARRVNAGVAQGSVRARLPVDAAGRVPPSTSSTRSRAACSTAPSCARCARWTFEPGRERPHDRRRDRVPSRLESSGAGARVELAAPWTLRLPWRAIRAATPFEANKLTQAPAPPGRRGDRRLLDDRGRRPRHGLPVRRQGQLRAARRAAARCASARRCRFEIVAVNLDQKQPGFPGRRAAALPRVARRAVPHRRAGHLQRRQAPDPRRRDDVLAVLAPAPRRALPRRGRARRTKIALGHHRDDMLATFFLNLFFGGKLKAMPPKLVSDDGRHVVIRPLAYVRERDLARYAELTAVPDHPVHAVRLAGEPAAQAGRRDAARVGEASIPGRIESIFNALGKVDAVAPARPRAARLRRGARDRPPRARRRHRVRRRRGARARDRVDGAIERVALRCERRIDARCARCVARARRGVVARLRSPRSRAQPRPSRRSKAPRSLAALRARRLRAVLPPHVDRLRPERRADDGYADCAKQRNLTDAGRAEARAIGAAIGGCRSRSAKCSRARFAARWKPADSCSAAPTRAGGARRARGGRRPTATRTCAKLLVDAAAGGQQPRDRKPRQSVPRGRGGAYLPKARPR